MACFIRFSLMLFVIVNVSSSSAQDAGYVLKRSGGLSFQCDTSAIYETLNQAGPLPDAHFYLLNELHQIRVNPYLQFALIKYLNHTKALRYVILEMSHSNAILYNLFLETGDTAILRKAASDGRHAPVLFHKLYELNKTLPAGKKIKFLGIDMTMMSRYTFRHAITQFWLTSKQTDRATPLTRIFETIKNTNDESVLIRLGKEAGNIITSDSALYREIFKEKYEDLRIITSNNFRDGGRRDDEMYENFRNVLSIYHIDSGQVFFGSFGSAHLALHRTSRTVKSLLEEHSFSGKGQNVCVLGVQYLNCNALSAFNVFVENDGIVPGFGKSYRKEYAEELAELKSLGADSKENIIIIPLHRNKGKQDGPDNTLFDKMDMLILCRNFPSL